MPRVPINNLPVNTPVEGAAPDATLVVEIDAAHTLPVGAHTFQLEVVDNSGNRSTAATARVVVADGQAPTAVINAPRTVPFGTTFTLSGAASFDVGGGTIARYIWTRID
jgi:chitodextrinase